MATYKKATGDLTDVDLTSIGDTGFSEYSSPGVAAEYEGSF